MSVKHFSRFGEFVASFELSKYGWDIYTPVYDEYVDLIIHKIVCKKCGKSWNTNPNLICDNLSCNETITSTKKKDIIANGKCLVCGHTFHKKNIIACPKCKSKNLESKPTCPTCKNGLIYIENTSCTCGSTNHIDKFRTIQVKASRIEKNKKSYAVDLRPRDLTQGDNHYYIWVCIDENGDPSFLVVPLSDFMNEAQNLIKSTSFVKDQGREHFNASNFGKWNNYLNAFNLLD